MRPLIILSVATGYGGAERSIEILLKHMPDDMNIHVYAHNALHIRELTAPGAMPKMGKLIRVPSPASAWGRRWASLRLWRDCLRNPHAHVIANTHTSALIAAITAKFLPSLGSRSFIYVRDFLWTDLDYIFRRLEGVRALLPSSAVANRLGYLSPYFLEPHGSVAVTVLPDMVVLPKSQSSYLGPFLHLATVNAWKGHIDLLMAMKALKEDGITLRTCSYGTISNVELGQKLRRFIAKLDIDQYYQLQGYIPDPASLLQSCTAVIITSRSHSGGPETFGRTVIEAWSHRKPIIAYKCGAVAELIEDGVDGLLVDEGDTTGLASAMKKLHESPETCRRLGEAGHQKVSRQFEAQVITQMFLETVS